MPSPPAVPGLSPLNYVPPTDVFDEAYEGARPRLHWQEFFQNLTQLGLPELQRRALLADQELDENGVTFGPITDDFSRQRPWKLDLVPFILDEATWNTIEAGIAQRARLLDALIKDLYGEQRSLHSGLLPPEAVFAHPGYLRSAIGLHATNEPSLIIYAAELARSPDGRFWVMADRTDAPVGAGFALENRIVAKRTLPHLSHALQVRRLASYFVRLKTKLRSMSPRPKEDPRIVLLSPGPTQPYYFEDVYLARYLGYELAQGGDLAVRDEQVFLKTLAGLVPVDVILSRGVEAGLDPVELGGGAPHGVPGLLQAVRAGNVAIANCPGSGMIESPVFMARLPQLAQLLLKEDLAFPSIATWWCHDADSRKYVLEHLEELVVKPAFAASGGEELIGPALTRPQLAELRKSIITTPHAYVAQELITRSAAPTLSPSGELVPGHIAFRVFATSTGEGFDLMPGGLIRVSYTPEPMELSISGGETSKDFWVRSQTPPDEVTLLPTGQRTLPLKRTGALFPSRVADDLFWLGQSMERSDVLARIQRAFAYRLISDSESTTPDTIALAKALLDLHQYQDFPHSAEDDDWLEQVGRQLADDSLATTDRFQLGHAVSEMLRLSSVVRDWLSPETWQQLHRTASEYFDADPNAKTLESALVDRLDLLIVTLASVMGLIDSGMIRGPAWRFLDLGRRIERAHTSAAYLLSLLRQPTLHDPTVLKMIIEVFDCQMTYRARYRDELQQNAVFDLCVTDSTNPRSIESQLTTIAVHIDALPDQSPAPLRNAEKRLVMSAVHTIRMLTSAELGDPEPETLTRALMLVETKIKELATLVERKYLLHSGEPRQILGNGMVL